MSDLSSIGLRVKKLKKEMRTVLYNIRYLFISFLWILLMTVSISITPLLLIYEFIFYRRRE